MVRVTSQSGGGVSNGWNEKSNSEPEGQLDPESFRVPEKSGKRQAAY